MKTLHGSARPCCWACWPWRAARKAARPATARRPQRATRTLRLAELSPEDREAGGGPDGLSRRPARRSAAMGTPVKVTVKGQPVFLCCDGCTKKALDDPDKTLAAVEKAKSEAEMTLRSYGKPGSARGRPGSDRTLRAERRGLRHPPPREEETNHDRETDRVFDPQPLPGPDPGGGPGGLGRLRRAQHAGGRHARPEREPGHRLHRLDGPQPPARSRTRSPIRCRSSSRAWPASRRCARPRSSTSR